MKFEYEQRLLSKGYDLVIGIDEAGRGPLAGPVVASAVALKRVDFSSKIADSKKISARQRENAFKEICENASVGIGIINETVIDENNILKATFFAMTNAVKQLISRLNNRYRKICLLVDGNKFETDLPYDYQTIVGGDTSVLSIACASIVAKLMRDRILVTYDKIFPEYGFRRHKGYPTAYHKQALRRFGPSIIHRKTFKY